MLALVPITLQDGSYFISILSIGFLNFELNIILTTTKQQTPVHRFFRPHGSNKTTTDLHNKSNQS